MSTPSRRENDILQKDLTFYQYCPSTAATATLHVFKARVPCRVTRVEYVSVTGLVTDAANYFTGVLKNGATTVCSVFNTNATGGAAIAANTVSTPAVSTVASATNLEAGDTLDLVMTKTGTQTLPDGHLRVYVTEI